MNEFLESLIFYKWQLAHALILGVLMAIPGVLVLLRRQSTYGLLASQAAVSSGILTGLWGGAFVPWLSLPLSLALAFPFYILGRKRYTSETILLGGMLFYVGLGEILAAWGHFRMHMLQSYFGDVLTMSADAIWMSLLLLILLLALGYLFYDSLILFSIDPAYALVIRLPVKRLDLLFFFGITLPLSWSIQQAGMFSSMAHMLLPALAVMQLSRSPKQAMLYAALLSMTATLSGFLLSFLDWPSGDEALHLPTSSLTLFLLGFFCLILLGIHHWRGHKNP